ncbi:hypothetical protein VTN00DRAFT_8679 [Thermoascus crustaceus]|uniref:uncharacterized protein n=1 Tax=Thermoascus crustaceus TaxID=5088 RepID=UPI0037445231
MTTRGATTLSADSEAAELPLIPGTSRSQGASQNGLDERQTLLDADEFAAKYNLDDIRDVLKKGALLACDLTNFERVEGLTEEVTGRHEQ